MEADVAKGCRDWAFSERDKVVLERESIRTLCDKLRRERDRYYIFLILYQILFKEHNVVCFLKIFIYCNIRNECF